MTGRTLTELDRVCRSMSGAYSDNPWEGHTAWKVGGKMFAILTDGEPRVTLKSTPDKQAALIMHPCISVAAYIGRHGWVTVEIPDEDTLELALELIPESYDLVVAKLPRSKRP